MRRMISVFLIAMFLALASPLGFPAQALAQCSFGPGAVIQLSGTPHLFVADEQGVLHWGGDTRALAGRFVDWSRRCEVGVDVLYTSRRGDPWLSTGLPKIGDPIYLAKWEVSDPVPTLLRIQSIADVELFGISFANYQTYVLDQETWQQRYGFDPGSLPIGPLASAASFAWPEPQRTAYGQLLAGLNGAESAVLRSRAVRSDGATILPAIADCERAGLSDFERSRNTSTALGIAQDCLARLNLSAPVANPIPSAPVMLGPPPSGVAGPTGPVMPPVAFAPPPAAVAPPPPGVGQAMVGAQPLASSTSGAAGAPTAPTGLRPTPLQGAGVRIDWTDAASNEDGYRVMRGGQVLATVGANATSFVDTAFVPSTAADCYTVIAFNSAGEAPSGQLCPGTASSRAPAAPGRLRLVIRLDNSGIVMHWNDNSSNEDGFRVLRRGVVIADLGPNVRDWEDKEPLFTMQNCYAIVAYNGAGESSSREMCPGDYGD